MSFRCTPPPKDPVRTLAHAPWKLAVPAFQVSPRTWYVSGQSWVGAYLIDTGDGCILLDTAIPESLYLLVDAVHQTGHEMRDIRMILLSHAHFDHIGGAAALRQMTGAPLYMSREDAKFLAECPKETLVLDPDSHAQELTIDRFYDDDAPIHLGDMAIRTLLTPGHTIGCTSFFWQEKNPVTGDIYNVAMHGGVGANTMNDKYYATSAYLTPDLRERFLGDADKVAAMPVDIALPSHPNQIEILDRAGTYTHEGQPYLDNTVWGDFIRERVRQVKVLME